MVKDCLRLLLWLAPIVGSGQGKDVAPSSYDQAMPMSNDIVINSDWYRGDDGKIYRVTVDSILYTVNPQSNIGSIIGGGLEAWNNSQNGSKPKRTAKALWSLWDLIKEIERDTVVREEIKNQMIDKIIKQKI